MVQTKLNLRSLFKQPTERPATAEQDSDSDVVMSDAAGSSRPLRRTVRKKAIVVKSDNDNDNDDNDDNDNDNDDDGTKDSDPELSIVTKKTRNLMVAVVG